MTQPLDLLELTAETFSQSTWEATRNHLMLSRYLRHNFHLKKYLKPDSLILDLGCGTGQNTYILKQMGYESFGVELSSHQFWQNLPSSFVVYDGADLPFQANIFEAVVMYGVLEHVGTNVKDRSPEGYFRTQRQRGETLSQIIRVLKPGGFLFVHNFPNRYSPIEIFLDLLKIQPSHHGSEKQSLREVATLVAATGFEILEAGRYGVLPASVGFMFPWIRENVINKFPDQINNLDVCCDQYLGNWIGQSNFVIAKKPS